MNRARVVVLAVLAALTAAAPATAAVLSVTAPKRIKAGASAKVVVAVDAVASCRLTVGKVSAVAPATGADRVTFAFKVSPKVRPARYTLTVRCGPTTRKVRMTVAARKGKRGTSGNLVSGKITFTTRKLPAPPPTPAPTPMPTPAATATPTPTPVVPGPDNSFRAVYALASDQTATPGYVAGIVSTINAVNGWFASQTTAGVMPRWMRDAGGAPQVTVVTLAHPKADYDRDGFALVRSDLLAAAPLAAPTQKTVLWMEVTDPAGACGSTSAGISWLPENACAIRPVAPARWPLDGTYLTAHEMAHNFGAVPDCAPHATGDHHVGDDTKDLLYSGPLGRDWNDLRLDPGHDDYYGSGTACGDIATSPFWTLTADPRS